MRALPVFVLLLAVVAKADELPPLSKSLKELEKYDPKEDIDPNSGRGEKTKVAKETYKNASPDASPDASPLDWSCKLSAKTVAVCEPVWAEFTVKNPSDTTAVRFPQPARGFLCRNVQVWVKAEGEKQFTCPLGQRRGLGRLVPVRVAPGETRRFSARLDNFASARVYSLETGELQVERAYWLGDVTFRTPGQYEVVIRYLNLGAGGEDDSVSKTERDDGQQVRLFGPFPLTVTDRPKGDPEWVGEVRELWEYERPKISCIVPGIHPDSLEPFTKLSLKELRSVGPAGDDVFLWTLAQQFGHLRAVKQESLKPFLADLDEAVCKLPANHPNRAAAEFLGLAARLNRGEMAAVRKALGSANPDVQVLAAEWLAAEEAKKKAK